MEIYDAFAEVYQPCEMIPMDLSESPCLPPKRTRTCRFCGGNHTTTTFNNDPHRFSKFFCNPYLIWDEECDCCNPAFSAYEKALAEWLGISRVFSDIRPGKKRFVFSSSDATVQARRMGQLIFFEQVKPGGFQSAPDKSEIVINTTPLPYIPAYVYNGFLKNALSALPKAELANYSPSFRVLRNEWLGRSISGFRQVRIIETNLTAEHSFALLYKRKKNDPAYPLYMFCLYVRNFMFQIALPINLETLKGGMKGFNFLPAHFFAKSAEGDEPFVFARSLEHLEGWDAVTPKQETLTLRPDKEDMKNAVSVQLPPDFLDKLKKSNW